MIWQQLILFVVAFLLTALLAPKPKIENAKREQFDPNSFPRVSQSEPIPLLLGKREMKGPNTIWYGDFKSEEITKKVKTGLFSSKRVTIGHRYYLGLELALCLGPDVKLHGIRFEKKRVWQSVAGVSTSEGQDFYGVIGYDGDSDQFEDLGDGLIGDFFGDVYDYASGDSGTETSYARREGGAYGDYFPGREKVPELWGGEENGGGLKGGFRFYSGQFTSKVNSYVNAFVDGPIPAYNGVARIVFERFYIGESPQLRAVDFVLSRRSNYLGIEYQFDNDEQVNIGEAIYAIMVDKWSGMKIKPSRIDIESFRTFAAQMKAEGSGCAVLVSSASEGKEVIRELLRQADGIMYQDPDSGLIAIKAIRQDYHGPSLLHLDESDIVSVRSFSKTSWEEVYAELKVEYGVIGQDSPSVVPAQDSALLSMMENQRSQTLVYPFLWGKTQANKLVNRERKAMSVPLARITLELRRNQRGLLPGSVFSMSWEEYGVQRMVFRVQSFDLGELLNGKVVLNAVQDEYAADDVIYADPEDSIFIPPVVSPEDIKLAAAIQLPYFFSSNVETPASDGQVLYTFAAERPSAVSTGFDTFQGEVSRQFDVRDPTNVPYAGTGALVLGYSRDAGITSGFDSTGFLVNDVATGFIEAASLDAMRIANGGILYMNGEWLGYLNAVEMSDGSWRISEVYRGLLGTTPQEHPPGTRVWAISHSHLPSGGSSDLNEGETLYWTVGNRIGSNTQSPSSLFQARLTAGDLADRPVRPAMVKIDGLRTEDNVVNPTVDCSITWNSRDRNRSQIAIEADSPQTPDIAETYDVDIMINGVRNSGLSGTGVSSPYTVPFSTTTGVPANFTGEVRVFSRRTTGNLRRSAGYAYLPFRTQYDVVMVSGDQQTGGVKLLTSGDQQNGGDNIIISGA